MATFLLLILLISGIASLSLYLNKGEKAEAIKDVLTDIFENIAELFSSLKKLFILLQGLLESEETDEQVKSDQDKMLEDSLEGEKQIENQVEIEQENRIKEVQAGEQIEQNPDVNNLIEASETSLRNDDMKIGESEDINNEGKDSASKFGQDLSSNIFSSSSFSIDVHELDNNKNYSSSNDKDDQSGNQTAIDSLIISASTNEANEKKQEFESSQIDEINDD